MITENPFRRVEDYVSKMLLKADMLDSNRDPLDTFALRKLKNKISANASRESFALFRKYMTELGNHLADLEGAFLPNLPAVWPQSRAFTAGTFSTTIVDGEGQWTVLVKWPQKSQAFTDFEVANFVWDCLGCEENQDDTTVYDSDFDDLVLDSSSSCDENKYNASFYDSDFDDHVFDDLDGEENKGVASLFDILSGDPLFDPTGTCDGHSSSSGATTGSSASASIPVYTSEDGWSFCDGN
jgi:hypothetical protein